MKFKRSAPQRRSHCSASRRLGRYRRRGRRPMTGQYAAFGEQMKRGAEQAVDDLNAKGGVKGEKIKLEVGDDACDPKQAVAVANQLVGKGVDLRLRPLLLRLLDPGLARSTAKRASFRSLPLRPTRSSPMRPGDNVFRICGRDDQQGVVAGQVHRRQLAARTSRSSTTRPPTARVWPTRCRSTERAGLKEKLYEAITPGDKDYSALVSKLKQANIDAALYRRLSHRGRPDRPPGERSGHECPDHVGRRAGDERILGRSPAPPARAP